MLVLAITLIRQDQLMLDIFNLHSFELTLQRLVSSWLKDFQVHYLRKMCHFVQRLIFSLKLLISLIVCLVECREYMASLTGLLANFSSMLI